MMCDRGLSWLVLFFLIAACDEPPPQWRDDAAIADKDISDENDIVDDDQSDQTDLSDLSDDQSEDIDVTDDAIPDDPVAVDCDVAVPSAAEKTALATLFPNGETICADKTPSGTAYFIAVKDGSAVGYAFPGTNYGFDGQVTALTGMKTDATSIAVAIVSQRESWWFRMGQWFFDQFKNIDITQVTLDPKYSDNCWPCTEMYDNFKPYAVDAVSGATYTSNAVTRDVWDAFYLYDEIFTPPTE